MKYALLFAIFSWALPAQDAESHFQAAVGMVKHPENVDSATLDRALAELHTVLRLRPDHIPARLEIGKILILRRDFGGAVQAANDVLRADPKHLQAQLLRAKALVDGGKPGVARLFLLDALKQHPDNADALFSLGLANMADRRFDEAEEAFRNSWNADSTTVRGMRGVAMSLMAREQGARALEVVQAEAAKFPGRRDLRTLAGHVATDTGRHDVAVESHLAVVKATDTPKPEELQNLGRAYVLKGESEPGIEYLRKAVAAAPGDKRFPSDLALALDQAGRKKEAEQVYRESVAADPKNPVLLNNLAWLLADTGGDLKEALGFAQRARELLPRNPEISDTVGWIYLKSNMIAEAADLFERLTVQRSTNPSFRYHFALALEAKGEKDRALREAKRALEDGPSQNDLPKVRELVRKLEGAQP